PWRVCPPPGAPFLPYPTLFRSPRARLDEGTLRRRFGRRLHHLAFAVARDRVDAHAVLIDRQIERDAADVGRKHRTVLADLQVGRSEEHTSELQSREHLVCRLLL